jgi:nitroreductase
MVNLILTVTQNRSYRRFFQQETINKDSLLQWINLARLSASGRNLQPLKYLVYNSKEECERLFSNLAWAGYLKEWSGPEEGERPSAYIVILGDTQLTDDFATDLGIAAQTILLGAVNDGFGGCMIGNIKREKLRTEFQIPDQYKILLVIALGKPKETIELEEVPDSGDIRYWRDENGVHHVPKRKLEDIVLNLPQ